jgi:TfoX/Sxy family transcriptional regulator of competence genes
MTHVAYDEDLANRLRDLLADEDAITEKKMFGGLAFLQHGNMSVSASRNGGLLVRIDPADADACLARPHVALMEMGGRTMDGWITVAPEGLKTKRELAAWVKRSLAFVKTLPPK